MKRLLTLVALVSIVAGCKSRGETVDPFFGRSTVDPPATGTITGRSIDPYYRPNSSTPPATATPAGTAPKTLAPQSSVAPQSTSGMAVSAPAAGTRYIPPTSSTYSAPASSAPRANTNFTSSPRTERVPPETLSLPARTTSSPITAAPSTATPANSVPATTPGTTSPAPTSTAPAPTTAPVKSPATTSTSASPVPIEIRPAPATESATSLADRPRIARTLEPRPKTEATRASSVTPTNYSPSTTTPQPVRSVNIDDLPAPATRTSLSVPAASPANDIRPLGEVPESNGSEVRAALALETVETQAEQRPASRGKYGYQEGYGVLRGKLEYSQTDRRWKLRYIPIDCEMDGYGGSVVLSNEAALAGFERDEMVEVRGKVKEQDQPKRAFSPLYDVTEIRRLTGQ